MRGRLPGGDVLIVSGPGGDAVRYRGNHRAEQLLAAGYAAGVCYREGTALAPLARRYRCIVLYRVPWDDEVARLLEVADASACSVVCDYDDLVFDPERVHLLRGLDSFEEEARAAYVEGLARQRRTLEACEGTTVATAPLVEPARKVASRVEVVHNVVSSEMVRDADAVARTRREAPVRIGYLSGTPTHDRDFLEAADAVLWALETDTRVQFVAAGFLQLDERFAAHFDRIERVAYQPWRRLPRLLATLDVNLAPLERDNAFVDCKSAIKYMEAALLAVPTVASARPDFLRVINHGSNGLLADTPEQWRESLESLLVDPDNRRLIGQRASADVRTRHVTTTTAVSAAAALGRLVPALR